MCTFLACFIEKGYDKKLSDEQIIEDFGVPGCEYDSLVIKQGNEVLGLDPFPKEEITTFTNLYFRTEKQCQAWLSRVLALLAEGKGYGGDQPATEKRRILKIWPFGRKRK